MFDIKNGKLYLAKFKMNIDQNLTHKDFCKSELYKKATPFIINPPYNSYKIEEYMEILGEKFIMVLFFQNEKLQRINFSFYNPNAFDSWENWSEEKELEIKKQYDNLLKQNFGDPPYEYYWGSLESIYDKRSGSAYLLVSYN
jgi:hypothetical protein